MILSKRYFYCSIFLGFLMISVHPELDYCSGNKINDIQITPKTLLNLAPQPPYKLKKELNMFFDEHPELIALISGDDKPYTMELEKRKDYRAQQNHTIEATGVKNLSKSNIIFEFPGNPRYLIRASSYINRRENMNSWLRDHYHLSTQTYGEILSTGMLAIFNEEYGTTFQTISQIAYWLRIHEFITTRSLKYVRIPQLYLYHLPGRPRKVSDKNYAIIAEKIPATAIPLSESPLILSPDVITELAETIVYSGLWDINLDANIFTDGTFVYCIDLEQPSVHKPTDFFLKNTTIYRSNVLHGLGGLRDLIRRYQPHHKALHKEILALIDAAEQKAKELWRECDLKKFDTTY